MWRADLTVPPLAEPLSLAEAKAHLRVDDSASDTLISSLIKVARGAAEAFTRRALVCRTYRLVLEDFAGADDRIALPYPPLLAISSISYVDSAGATQSLAAADYQVEAPRGPHAPAGALIPAYGEVWPTVRGDTVDAVQIVYTAGYAVPFTVDTATDKITPAGRAYTDGEAVRLSTWGGTLPTGVAAGTTYYIVSSDVTAGTNKLAASAGGAAIDLTAAGTAPYFLGEVPEEIRQGMLLVIGDLFDQRATFVVGAPVAELPRAAEALWWPYRALSFEGDQAWARRARTKSWPTWAGR